jgi:hypothetical protein
LQDSATIGAINSKMIDGDYSRTVNPGHPALNT